MSVTIPGSYFKINPSGLSPNRSYWGPAAFNQSANLLTAALLVHKHTVGGVQSYVNKATKLKAYILGPELRYVTQSTDYPYWPYATDHPNISDLDHTTFDMEFLFTAYKNGYAGVTADNLKAPLKTVRDYAFKMRYTNSPPIFSDWMNGTVNPDTNATGANGMLKNDWQPVVASVWTLLPNANEISSTRNVSFNDQVADMLEWYETKQQWLIGQSKYLRSAAEFILATKK